MSRLLPVVVAWALAAVMADPPYTPAQLRRGNPPVIPLDAVGGGEVLVEVEVNTRGAVTRAKPLRTTPPFTDVVMDAVRGWQFEPARELVQARGRSSQRAVASSVLVAAVYRAPVLVGPTLGEPPRNAATPSSAVALPAMVPAPPFPANALLGGTVLLEVLVGPDGAIDNVAVLRAVPPFDEVAVKAVREWTFRPAQRDGVGTPAVVYVVFGFRAPVQPPGQSATRTAAVTQSRSAAVARR
jgi:TonB family protein